MMYSSVKMRAGAPFQERPILPQGLAFKAPNNSISGSIPEGLQFSGLFQTALRATQSKNRRRASYLTTFVLDLEMNKLAGTIPGFFFDAINSSTENPSISMTINLDVRAQNAQF